VAGADHQRRDHEDARGASHQYFTQTSSLADSDVRGVTPAVLVIWAAVWALALYAALPFQTMTASPKKTERSGIAAGTVYLFQPGLRAGTRFTTGAGLAPPSWIQSSLAIPPSPAVHVWCARKETVWNALSGNFTRTVSL